MTSLALNDANTINFCSLSAKPKPQLFARNPNKISSKGICYTDVIHIQTPMVLIFNFFACIKIDNFIY